MSWKERTKQVNDQARAQSRAPSLHDINTDIALAFKEPQIALYRPSAAAKPLCKIADGDFQSAPFPVTPVGFFKHLTGAPPRSIRKVAIIL